ncbi:hypothetical protein FRC11_007367, partial [Ceratobasidium sp. 423]
MGFPESLKIWKKGTKKGRSPNTNDAARNNWPMLIRLQTTLQAVGEQVSVVGVINDLLDFFGYHEDQARLAADYTHLHRELEDAFEFLAQKITENEPPALKEQREAAFEDVKGILNSLKQNNITRGTTSNRLRWAQSSPEIIIGHYRRFHSTLHSGTFKAILAMGAKIEDIHVKINLTNDSTLLQQLDRSEHAPYDAPDVSQIRGIPCARNTRVGVLREMRAWIDQAEPMSVFWLTGMAGTGKTTICYTLCRQLVSENRLAASFFCSRLHEDCRKVKHIFPSIACQVAKYSSDFRDALLKELRTGGNIHGSELHKQFERLIERPLGGCASKLTHDLIIVIDALDECDGSSDTAKMLGLLLLKAKDLRLRFIVSSRPERDIINCINRSTPHINLHKLKQGEGPTDMEEYLHSELDEIDVPKQELDFLIGELARLSGTFFIFAATATRWIKASNNRHSRLVEVLNPAGPDANRMNSLDIDRLYDTILKSAFNDKHLGSKDKENLTHVLETVVCAQEPLAIKSLAGLLNVRHDRVREVIDLLPSVLQIAQKSELVTPLHYSFVEFMLDQERSGGFHCDAKARNLRLAKFCFDYLERRIPLAIAETVGKLGSPSKVDHAKDLTKVEISPLLLYTCSFWGDHLRACEVNEERSESRQGIDKLEFEGWLKRFLSVKLLLWLQVLALQGRARLGPVIMHQMEKWCLDYICDQELVALVHDAWRFTATFASGAVSQSTSHVHTSMLPFWPQESPIFHHYRKYVKNTIRPEGPAIGPRPALLATWSLGEPISTISLSPDGSCLAIGVGNKICVLDAFTGLEVLPSLVGHEKEIRSLQFSPDGNYIVSGSNDTTICVWNARSGMIFFGPIKNRVDIKDRAGTTSMNQDNIGQDNWVTSVAFSHDGDYIASGSDDSTVCVWDFRRRGDAPLYRLKGHVGYVTAVMFSADDRYIVSGSSGSIDPRDSTCNLCLWHISEPLEDSAPECTFLNDSKINAVPVTAVDFSPNSSVIISGLSNGSLQMWDVEANPLKTDLNRPDSNHMSRVTSIKFSYDGTRFVSGYDDSTIWMWDAINGQVLLGPLKGHTESVTATQFSSSGLQLITSSADGRICLWDAQVGQTNASPSALLGHTDSITSVAISLNGALIVSGSRDKTIGIWNSQDGDMVFPRLEGHRGPVTSVDFSILDSNPLVVSASEDGTIRVWDGNTGSFLYTLVGHEASVTTVKFSPNGTRIISGSADKTIRIWSSRNKQTVMGPLGEDSGPVTTVSFSFDGVKVASGSSDNTIRVWGVRSGEMLYDPLRRHTGSITAVRFSLNGTRIISSSDDKTIIVWDADRGTMLGVLLSSHSGPIRCIDVLGYDSDHELISYCENAALCLWDGRREPVLDTYNGHSSPINSVAISPNGQFAVSGSEDRTIRVWDLRPKQPQVPSDSWKLDEKGWVNTPSDIRRR